MTPELRDFARRLADEIQGHQRLGGREPVAWALRKLAAEDAEREQVSSDARSHGSPSTREDECQLSHAGAGNSAPAAGSLPPLDPALVEECAKIEYERDGSCLWERNDAGYRRERVQDLAAALTHYRERVERPLREELWQARETSKKWLDGLESAERNVAHFRAEADHLRAELNQYDERGHEAKLEIDHLRGELESEKVASRRYADSTDTAIACGSHDDPTAGNCGECRACVVAERDRLRRELAKQVEANRLLAAERDGWQAACNRSRREREEARVAHAPQPTDEERQRLAAVARYYGGLGASSLVYVRADDMRRIATLLEQPAPRKSIGRRWVLMMNGEPSNWLMSKDQHGFVEEATTVLCDLVPVAEEEKP